ncbi:MAG TPA: hypothetical protein VL547_18005, partial [Dinghuibacter sp.]|uniref:hypothetical protein n=1 Tax=Dinghuibacter sp. TaxID=2024697 RepID=UPI002C344E5A
PLTIALACLVGWVALATRTPVIAFGVVLVPALVLTVLRKPIWNLFSEPATIELGVDFFSIDLSGTSFRYDFGQLNGYKVYQGVYTSQITVYPADSKERTFAFLEKSTTADTNPVLAIEQKIQAYNESAGAQKRIMPGLSFLASRPGAVWTKRITGN